MPGLTDIIDRRAVTIRILVIADSAVGFNPNFGVGKAVEAIRAGSPNNARLEVDLARRDQIAGQMDAFAVNPAANQTNLTAKYRGLRFNHAENGSRTPDPALQIITQYDQVWVFGFAPLGDRTLAVEDDELEALTRWMDERNGGVFATGDCDTLGAALAMRIPRVSTMRRWTRAGGPPKMPEGGRTLSSVTHPILCGGGDLSAIDVLSGHSHDGWVNEDAEVDLAGTTLTGTAEYPSVGAVRETPHAISWTSILHSDRPASQQRAALIGVYNGHPSGVGRVAVDSTWRHWMDSNLSGLEAAATTALAQLPMLTGTAKRAARQSIANYDNLIRYFINIAIWLAPPSKQPSMLSAATRGTITQPTLFEESSVR